MKRKILTFTGELIVYCVTMAPIVGFLVWLAAKAI